MLYKDPDFELHHSLTASPNEAAFPMHAHSLCEIYCFLSGQGYYTVEGHDYPLTPGCILIMRDGETHKLHISPDRPYERIALHFSTGILADMIGEGERRGDLLAPFRARPLGQHNRLSDSPALDRVRDMLLRITDGTASPAGDRARILAYLPAILYELAVAALVEDSPDAPTMERPLVGRIIEFINQDPAAITNMEALEERFGFSRSYLNRTFRQSTGVSIWDYVILKRLTLARQAIRHGAPAAAAATAAGYADYSSFYRQYKKRFGLSPEEEKRRSSGK